MIYVEMHYLDPKTSVPYASISKHFDSLKEFNDFYKLAKEDPHSVLNVLNYDPVKNPGQKSVNDAKLFGMSLENKL